ncbi:DUF2993 domain-containing protein [Agromyces sp. SYSU K20354]|uniref:LmeA family phospholipid-binding protein n=1 Tax=Agromyces cavernae TaxID=2898659 RepID=UPI001E3F44EA|nr:DUF2993 domain-containing protein [Agromyces cavernae]MCD2443953.1 DUF2993 domain-containing protein [Agromyces cavernae]
MTDSSRDDHPTEVYPTEVLTPMTPAAEPRRPRRAARVWIIVVAVIVGVAALLVIADVVVRGIAEQRVAEQIEAELPPGVEGEVDVTIGGFSVLAQYLTGTIDRVELSAPELLVEGAPLDVDVALQGVPVDFASPIAQAEATVVADEATVNRLIEVAGIEGGLTLGDGAVAYERSIEVDLLSIPIPITVEVTATPVAAGDTVVLESIGVDVSAAGGSVDLSGLADRIIGENPIEICVAERLPEGVEVTGIAVTEGSVTVDAHATDLRLDDESLADTGACT